MNRTKRWFRSLFRRRVHVIVLLLLQIFLIAYLVMSGSNFLIINFTLTIISFIVALHIIAKNDKAAYKLTWVFLILTFPLFGGLFYLLCKGQSSTKRFSKQLDNIEEASKELFILPNNKPIREDSPLCEYLENFSNFPVYDHSESTFLSSGEEMFQQLLEELKKAKKYIFLEYYIVKEGLMWNRILEILKEKVKEGVEVRIIYDDMGCFLLLPNDYVSTLESYGIHCVRFNKFRPFLATIQNNRDHRKLAIIDGFVAFTGGINLSDEYINVYPKLGHWKDSGIKLKGKAAWSFTLMFLQLWSICKRESIHYIEYYPSYLHKDLCKTDGFIQPYADSPIDKENIGEHVYLHVINRAEKYIYINTPYLIIDDSMTSALKLAAKSGIEVKITVPYQADRKLIHFTTRSYYRDLIKSGVKIYEYKKGFIHSKTFISDDKIAVVGTTNLDFRSLYLNFECGCCVYKASCIKDIKKDFVSTLETCKEITLEDCKGNLVVRFLQDICRLFAPLM